MFATRELIAASAVPKDPVTQDLRVRRVTSWPPSPIGPALQRLPRATPSGSDDLRADVRVLLCDCSR
jgi:hypothetical protein